MSLRDSERQAAYNAGYADAIRGIRRILGSSSDALARQLLLSDEYLLSIPLEDDCVDFCIRVYNTLKRKGINTLGDLVKNSPEELTALRNFGGESLQEVNAKLANLGLSLRQEESASRR